MKHLLSIIFLVSSIVIAGCEARVEGEPQQPSDATVDRSRFGDPYRIVGNYSQADPDLYPILSSDTLVVRVTYAGGCESHRLDVDHDVRDDTAFVWIEHDARNDDCEALIQDEVQAILPERVLEADVIAILHPQGGPPQILSR